MVGPRRAGALLAFAAALGFGGAAAAAEDRCAALAGIDIPSSVSVLPTAGGKVLAAQGVSLPAGGAPVFCRVTGELSPVGVMAWPIKFQVNLPATWNGKALQFGGGGLNGVLVTGEGQVAGAPPSQTPLERGYATFGTDAGHPILQPDPQVFALNDEAAVNQAYAAYKKTYDVARSLIARYYGRPPARTYFYGNSEGGREALNAVQRYPADYDGAVAIVPTVDWAGQHLAHHREWILQQDGGWVPPAKLLVLQTAVRAACDGLDGLSDGVLSRYEGCGDRFDPRSLRCPDGADAGQHCLSDRQLAFVEGMYGDKRFAFPLANGVRAYAGSPYGAEAAVNGGVIPSIMVSEPPRAGDLGRPLAGPGSVRYYFMRDPAFAGAFDERAHEARIRRLSAMFDSTDPDIGPFAERGGKLIMKESGADYLRAPGGTYAYYRAVVAKLGEARAAQAVRLYVNPGVGHGGSGLAGDGSALPDRVDLLEALDAWVDRGSAPGTLQVVAYRQGATEPLASRPLCLYPQYPHYTGDGDPKQAASYRCRRP